MTNRALTSIGRRLGSALIGLLLGAAGAEAYAAGPAPAAECTSCHDQGQKLAKSAHKGLPCDTCHDSHEKYPHPANIPKPQCVTCHADQAGDYEEGVHGLARKAGNEGAPDCEMCHGSAHELLTPRSQAFRAAVPDTCGMCHSDEATQYRASVHGQALANGITQAPLCTDCHGEHKIIKHTNAASPVNPLHIRDTCGSCHGDVRLTRKFGLPSDRLVSFDSSYHGLAAKEGSQTVANCASCHGVHNILPSSDPNSTINPKNLPKTCGQCHPGAGTRFAISQVHVTAGSDEPPILRWVRQFYLLLIPVTIGLMLLHQGGDRGVRRRPRGPAHAAVRARAARAPGAFLHDLGLDRLRAEVPRRLVVAAAAGAGGHALHPQHHPPYRCGGLHRGLGDAPGFADRQPQAAPTLAGNDPQPERPARGAFRLRLQPGTGFRAAGVWGAVVMASTGLLLWANNLAMRYLPKVWLDVATSVHFYEALLATLAIVVWHFYSIIFDPDVYPLNTAFLTGYSSKKTEHSREQHETTKAAGD